MSSSFTPSRPTITTPRLLLRPLERSDVADIHAIRSLPEVMKWTSYKAETSPNEAEEWIEMILGRCDAAHNFCVEELLLPSLSRDSQILDPNSHPLPPSSSSTSSSVTTTTTTPNHHHHHGRGHVIGIIGAHNIPFVGYLFHPSVWGKGYATEALTAYLPLYWAFVPKAAAAATVETAIGPNDENGSSGNNGNSSNSSSSSRRKGFDYAVGDIDPENWGSRKVMLKCGFEEWAHTYHDFQSPNLGLRDSVRYRVARPGTVLKRD